MVGVRRKGRENCWVQYSPPTAEKQGRQEHLASRTDDGK